MIAVSRKVQRMRIVDGELTGSSPIGCSVCRLVNKNFLHISTPLQRLLFIYEKNPNMPRQRVRHRTHASVPSGAGKGASTNSSAQKIPKSMVIRIGAGEVGPSVSQLVKDVRSMMEPETAVKLKVFRILVSRLLQC